MSSYPLVKFVDSPAVGATVRLDLNDRSAAAPRGIEADIDLGVPTLEGDPDAVGQQWGFRSPRFTVQLKGTKANALAFVSALSKELNRRTNWLLFQIDAARSPVWLRTYRTGYQSLSLEQVYGNSATGGNASAGYPDVWRVEVPLVADAFAYGPRVAITQAQIIQSPADLAGPTRLAMRYVLPAIKGDAPTGLRVQLSAMTATTPVSAKWLVGCIPCASTMTDPVIDIGIGDVFTAGTGTGAGTSTSGTAYFSGSYRVVTLAANDLTTGSNFAQRLTGGISGLQPGRYKVLLRYEADAPSNQTRNYLFAFGRPRLGTPVYGATKTITVGTVGSGVAATSQGWVDLGDFGFPFGLAETPEGLAPTMTSQTVYLKIGDTANGTGTVRIDALKFIPIGGKFVNSLARTLTADSPVNSTTTAKNIFDTDTESYLLLDTSGNYADTTVALSGGFPFADPAAEQNILELVCLGGFTGATAHVTTGPASKDSQTALDVSYYPRYLHIGDGT